MPAACGRAHARTACRHADIVTAGGGSYAAANTRRGVESCGILAGSLDSRAGLFRISTLIVPKQEGTSDTVQALAEEEIFEAQDARGLYPMGWIHTHPTQTCFLSSIDVHTQCGYQARGSTLPPYSRWQQLPLQLQLQSGRHPFVPRDTPKLLLRVKS